jgi:adenine-specific DNA-methyltransferase
MKVIGTIKQNGVHFTPKALGDFLSDKILNYCHLNGDTIKILDPSCGEGQLLLSISEKLSDKLSVELKGFDTDASYIKKAEHNLFKGKFPYKIDKNDFLEVAPISAIPNLFSLFDDTKVELYDIIIANPPYVRTQILGTEKSKEIAAKYNLKGRLDLYYPFLIAMTNVLKENGIIGVLTSNRYLFTKSGESIRCFLRDNFEILEIIDLGDTKFFEAAVLPAIFIGKKKTSNNKDNTPIFSKIYEDFTETKMPSKELSEISDLLHQHSGAYKVDGKYFKKTEGIVKFSEKKTDLWVLQTKQENDWVNKIEKNSKYKVEDFFNVKVGVKTTADNVFIRNDWKKMTLDCPEEEILRPLLSQENISKWSNKSNIDLKILYPYTMKSNKKALLDISLYPKTKKYLENHKEQLEARTYLIEAKRAWYEIWVTQNPDLWKHPKLVFPDISLEPRFCIDQTGLVVNGNCYWISAKNDKEKDLLYLIQGIANSEIMTKYHDLCFNNKLYSGRRRYFSQYVEKYPLPDINSIEAKNIIELSKKINNETLLINITYLEKELELAVAKAYNI